VITQFVVEINVGAAWRVEPVSSLLTTISSFMFAGSSMNRPLRFILVLLRGLAVFQDVLGVSVELYRSSLFVGSREIALCSAHRT